MTPNQKRFIDADFAGKVRLAQRVAQDILLTSTIDLESDSVDQEGIMARLSEVIGHDGPACSDDELQKLIDSLEACYALGIAVGLLMKPEVFRAGRAR